MKRIIEKSLALGVLSTLFCSIAMGAPNNSRKDAKKVVKGHVTEAQLSAAKADAILALKSIALKQPESKCGKRILEKRDLLDQVSVHTRVQADLKGADGAASLVKFVYAPGVKQMQIAYEQNPPAQPTHEELAATLGGVVIGALRGKTSSDIGVTGCVTQFLGQRAAENAAVASQPEVETAHPAGCANGP